MTLRLRRIPISEYRHLAKDPSKMERDVFYVTYSVPEWKNLYGQMICPFSDDPADSRCLVTAHMEGLEGGESKVVEGSDGKFTVTRGSSNSFHMVRCPKQCHFFIQDSEIALPEGGSS